jgi:hypothetical protein
MYHLGNKDPWKRASGCRHCCCWRSRRLGGIASVMAGGLKPREGNGNGPVESTGLPERN